MTHAGLRSEPAPPAGGNGKFPCGSGNCCTTGKEICSNAGMCMPAPSPPPPAYMRKRSLMGLKDE